jgi:hypothetical protein
LTAECLCQISCGYGTQCPGVSRWVHFGDSCGGVWSAYFRRFFWVRILFLEYADISTAVGSFGVEFQERSYFGW